jgi:hypothetical protein
VAFRRLGPAAGVANAGQSASQRERFSESKKAAKLALKSASIFGDESVSSIGREALLRTLAKGRAKGIDPRAFRLGVGKAGGGLAASALAAAAPAASLSSSLGASVGFGGVFGGGAGAGKKRKQPLGTLGVGLVLKKKKKANPGGLNLVGY